MTRPREEPLRDFGGARASHIEPARRLCTDEAVGRLLRLARKRCRLPLQIAAQNGGLSPDLLEAKEAGRIPIDASELPELCAAVGLSIAQFEGGMALLLHADEAKVRSMRSGPHSKRFVAVVGAVVIIAVLAVLAAENRLADHGNAALLTTTERHWCVSCAGAFGVGAAIEHPAAGTRAGASPVAWQAGHWCRHDDEAPA